MLETNDYNVFSANNGQETIEFLQKTEIVIDLVLLDYNMPIMDGWDVLVWMKNKVKFQNIPVIMMSTEDEVKNLSYCIERGAADYMVKPIRSHNIRGLAKYMNKASSQHPNTKSVADYEKVRTLGRGASGMVDLVTSKKDLEVYAMKMILLFHYDEHKKKAVQNEITLLRVLDSPYIVKYFDHFVKNGNMYIIMEYCEGGTIDDKIQQCKIEGTRYFLFPFID